VLTLTLNQRTLNYNDQVSPRSLEEKQAKVWTISQRGQTLRRGGKALGTAAEGTQEDRKSLEDEPSANTSMRIEGDR
jgi:hypothetical protein